CERNRSELELHTQHELSIPEAIGPKAIGSNAIETDVCHQELVTTLKAAQLGQQDAIFRDHAMAAEDHVGGRFPYSAGGVDISGDAAPRLVHDQLPPIAALADDFVAGG